MAGYRQKNGNWQRKILLFNLDSSIPKLIYLSHEWGGGVELYLQNKIG
jgi:hypothetical protein